MSGKKGMSRNCLFHGLASFCAKKGYVIACKREGYTVCCICLSAAEYARKKAF